jgi:polyhydroxyalkanoate synthesis regulator phasin
VHVNEAVQRYVEAASGLRDITRRKAEQIVKGLVRSGEAASDQANELVQDLIDRQQRNREALGDTIRSETKRVVRSMGLATAKEVERLEAEVSRLKRELARARGTSSGGAKKTAAKKSGTKKATAKKPAPAKKGTAAEGTAATSRRSWRNRWALGPAEAANRRQHRRGCRPHGRCRRGERPPA